MGVRNTENTRPVVQVKPYSVKELSQLYGMSVHTITRWLRPFEKQIGERNGRYYTNLQVEKIFELIGEPGAGDGEL